MYDDILVPTDGSPGSTKAVRRAADFAATYGATLHGVYVVESKRRPPLSGITGGAEFEADLRAAGEDALDGVEAIGDDHGVEVVTTLLEGTPHQQILRYADERDVDMIVMGTHGRTGLERTLVGSVTERVVREAAVPVVTVSVTNTDPVVTSEAEAADLAREELQRRGYGNVTVEEGSYRQRSSWVVRASADGRTFTVYVDNASGDAHPVDITPETDAA